MELEIKGLLEAATGRQTGEESFDMACRDFEGFAPVGPVRLWYDAVFRQGAVHLTYRLDTQIRAECSRCLDEFEMPLQLENEFRLTAADIAEEFPELPFGAGGKLDLEEFAYQEIVLNVFPVFTCTDACQGLCSTCGQKKAVCSCPNEPQGDPRLQILKQLLTDDGE